MSKELDKYLDEHFDPAKTAEEIIAWIRKWFEDNGPESVAVVGLSGGKDSTSVASLCARALGKDRVIGVLMPDHTQSDIDVSRKVAEYLGIRHYVVNIGDITDAVKNTLGKFDFELSDQTRLNIPPRVRMTVLYAISQSFNGRVSNNCNRSENYVGYSTLFGDAAGDFSVLHNLTVSEIIRLGEYLGIPDEFIYKKPSDGLSGKTDEDNFGFTYDELDRYIFTGTSGNERSDELIRKRHLANDFKMHPMDSYKPE